MSSRSVSLAKTTRPSIAGVLPRDRLFTMLDATPKSVIWVTGPPGCGKTTLVASYLERRKQRSLWYQVDEGDADVASFLYYLGLAAIELRRKPNLRLPQLTPEYHVAIYSHAAIFRRCTHISARHFRWCSMDIMKSLCSRCFTR